MTEDLSSSCASEPYLSLAVSLFAGTLFATTLTPVAPTVPLSIFSLVAAVLELSISFELVNLVGAVLVLVLLHVFSIINKRLVKEVEVFVINVGGLRQDGF